VLTEKCEELRNVIQQVDNSVNVVIDDPKETKKKEPLQFVFKELKQKNIEVKIAQKIDSNEIISDPKIEKVDVKYVIIKEKNSVSKLIEELQKDDTIIKISEDLSCSARKVTKEERIEELTCYGDAMGKLEDAIGDKMVGGDMSLKNKILRDREKYKEKKTFKERKEKLETHLKTNVEVMLENRKIMLSTNEREELNSIDRKCYRELKYEMDPYEWTVVKLPNGKTKAVIAKESEEYKNWRIDDTGWKIPEQVIVKRQAIIDSFEIINSFSKSSGNMEHSR
jgi:hypothetical protein